jgi:hypothetical protein
VRGIASRVVDGNARGVISLMKDAIKLTVLARRWRSGCEAAGDGRRCGESLCARQSGGCGGDTGNALHHGPRPVWPGGGDILALNRSAAVLSRSRPASGGASGLARVWPLLAVEQSAWMTTIRVARESCVHYWDTPLGPQLYQPNRRWVPGRLMGVSTDTRRTHTGASPWITLVLSGAPPATAKSHNARQAHCQRTECSFPGFGPPWKAGKERQT